ncbi:MAG TPA: BamA/TamA family outer membrane protein [Verrucomicrobiaceae bacterium]
MLSNPFSPPPKDLRYGIGLGLRYKLPIGPLRIDYGFNPDRKDGEAVGALHITFGFAF